MNLRFGYVRSPGGVGGLFEHQFDRPFDLVSVESLVSDEYTRAYYSIGVANRLDNIQAVLDQIPDIVLEACRAGRLAIILDNSGEASTLGNKCVQKLHEAIRSKGLPARLIAYVSHDLGGALRYSGECRALAIHQTDRIHILYYHRFFWHLMNNITISPSSDLWFQQRESRFLKSIPTHKFLCLMHKVRRERISLALNMIKAEIWNDGLISFGGIDAEEERNKLFEERVGRKMESFIDSFLRVERDTSLLEHMAELRSKGRVVLDGDDPLKSRTPLLGIPAIVGSIPESLYANTFFSIVSETEMIGRRHRYTEKILKPFSSYHSFVVLGNPFSLEAVRELGFETFHSHIDESYDLITNPNDRFDAAFSEIARMARLSMDQHLKMRKDLVEILHFNAHHYFFHLSRVFQEVIQWPFLNRLKAMFFISEPPS